MYFDKLKMSFIHIPKNAGTSIEQTLLQTYYNSDLKLYERIAFDTIAKNKLLWSTISLMYSTNYVPDTIDKEIITVIRNYHEKLSDCEPKDMILFTVVRNPYARIESLYKFTCSYKLYTFPEFIHRWFGPNHYHLRELFDKTQVSYICDASGKIDPRVQILKYESLTDDWRAFCKQHKLKCKTLLRENVSNQSTKIKWTKSLRKLVSEHFREDFEQLGYTI